MLRLKQCYEEIKRMDVKYQTCLELRGLLLNTINELINFATRNRRLDINRHIHNLQFIYKEYLSKIIPSPEDESAYCQDIKQKIVIELENITGTLAKQQAA